MVLRLPTITCAMEFLSLAVELISLLRLGCASMLFFVPKKQTSESDAHSGQAVEFLRFVFEFQL